MDLVAFEGVLSGDVVSVEQTPGTVFMEALNLIRFGISGNTTLF